MPNPIKKFVQDYSWIHLSIGLAGNSLFFVGSVLFLPVFNKALKPFPVWIFIIGSFLMLIGAVGHLLVKLYDNSES